MADTSDTLDIFNDGSCLELVQFNSNLHTYSHSDFTLEAGILSFDPGVFYDAVRMDGSSEISGFKDFDFTGELQGDAAFSCHINLHSLPSSDVAAFNFSRDAFGSFLVVLNGDNDLVVQNGWGEIGKMTPSLSQWYHIVINWDWTNSIMEAFVEGMAARSRRSK